MPTPPPNPDRFYETTLDRLVREQVLKPRDSILVVCGGPRDHAALRRLGFTRVTVSNLDPQTDDDAYAPYAWSAQDAEALSFPDAHFDFSLVHSGLHHCHSPHRALLEMYRVARRGVVLFEPYDSTVARLGVRLGFGQEYEHAAVFYNAMTAGGVRNCDIPNYVYRWTRREIVRCIQAFAPYGPHQFRFIHQMRIPWEQLRGRKNKLFLLATATSLPLVWLLGRVFPTQCNGFAAVILKPELPRGLHPWLEAGADGLIRPKRRWFEQRFNGSA